MPSDFMKPQPNHDGKGVPWCTEDCQQHDGKRCELLGQRPGTICEPAVEEMAAELVSLRVMRARRK